MEKYEYQYPHPAVATDCVVFGFDGRDLKVLLIQRGIEPYKGMWAFPGGFMHIDETAEECAVRELREETGLILSNVRQLGAFSGVHRDPRERIVSIAFYALARQSEVRGGDDAAGARWWAIDDIPQLAFDHDYILRQAMRRIRQDIHFEPVGFGLLEEAFTIADLQRLYECILGVHFDRRNFHRKMLQTGILQEVDENETRAARIRTLHAMIRNGHTDEVINMKPQHEQYYGPSKEMKRQSINALFGEPTDDAESEPKWREASTDNYGSRCFSAVPNEEAIPDNETDIPLSTGLEAPPDGCDNEPSRPRNAGRKGKLFRFDKEKYNQLKDGDSFRLEF